MHLRVVLVQPLYEGNVGSVARAMKNFGFRDLVMVNPCRIEDFGLAMASHARDVLQMSKSFSSLGEAIEGANLVVGTTGKRLDLAQHHLRLHLRVPCLTPAELAGKLQGMDGTVALLLGREDCGLNSDELALCDMLVSIPTSKDYPVMNLSHSAAVLFYELRIGKLRLRVFVEILHVGVRGSRIEIEVVLLHVLAMVSLGAGQAEHPLLQERVTPVPEGEGEAEVLVAVADAGDAVQRAVWVGGFSGFALGVHVAPENLALRFQVGQGVVHPLLVLLQKASSRRHASTAHCDASKNSHSPTAPSQIR